MLTSRCGLRPQWASGDVAHCDIVHASARHVDCSKLSFTACRVHKDPTSAVWGMRPVECSQHVVHEQCGAVVVRPLGLLCPVARARVPVSHASCTDTVITGIPRRRLTHTRGITQSPLACSWATFAALQICRTSRAAQVTQPQCSVHRDSSSSRQHLQHLCRH